MVLKEYYFKKIQQMIQYLHPGINKSTKTNEERHQEEEQHHRYEVEVLPMVEALKKLLVYLLVIKFNIWTDCSAVAVTMNKKYLCTSVAIEHRRGCRMKYCDSLSK